MFQITRWKVISILAVIGVGLLMALPNLFSEDLRAKLPGFMPSSPMVLGLDLRGGSYVLLEVDKAELKKVLIKQLIGDVRQTLAEKKIRYTGLGRKDETVNVRITKPEQLEKALVELKKLARPVSTGVFGSGTTAAEIELTQDGNQISFAFSQQGLEAKIGRAIEQAIEVIGRRINALGTAEPTIQRQGVDRILIQFPGLQNPERLKSLIGKTAKLTFQLLCGSQPDSNNTRPPVGCDEVVYQKTAGQNAPPQKLWVKTSRRATVSGEDLVDAQPTFDGRTNEPVVSFRFNQKGALLFGRLSQKNVGRRFAIILDNEVVSAPVIQQAILGGSGQISGSFTTETAGDLAIVLRSGALPAKLTIVEERTVGPSLGRDSVRAGFLASLLGLAGVLVFMILTYGLFGVFANIALLANLSLLIGVLSGLGATLTLPGIAGIVLTMGMAVDSNVLIFERIREEARNGRSTLNAIETGFARALGTVLDANITTLIAAFVLFGLGSGPVRGFAVTLGIGIITTVFTAYTLTKLVVAWWTISTKPKSIPL